MIERSPNKTAAGPRIQSVNRALDILELCARRRNSLGVTEISRALRITKGAAHALVTTLADREYLQQETETRRYRLGVKSLQLGLSFAQNSWLGRAVHPWADQLCDRFQEEVHVALLAGDVALIINRFEPKRPHILPFIEIGSALPIHASAAGKALLAFAPADTREKILKTAPLNPFTPNTLTGRAALRKELDRIVRQGYSLDREEALKGVCCAGAPIRDQSGKVVAAVSLSGPTERINRKGLAEIAEAVQVTALRISSTMGHVEQFVQPAFPKGLARN